MTDQELRYVFKVYDRDLREFMGLIRSTNTEMRGMGVSGARAGAGVAAGMRRARTEVKSFRNTVAAARAELRGIGKVALPGIAGGAFGVGGIAAMVAKAGLGFDALKQRSQLAFTTIFRSSAKAKSLLGQLVEISKFSPFRLRDLIDLTQQLAAMGISFKQIVPVLGAIGDASAGLGGDVEKLQRIVLAIGQINAKGTTQAEELRQLANVGIPAWKALAKELGVSIPEAMSLVKKRGVDSATGLRAVFKAIEEEFHGLQAKQSQTFSGALANLKDMFDITSGRFVTPFFKRTTEEMLKLQNALNTPETQRRAERLGNELYDKVVPAIESAVQWLRRNWSTIVADFKLALQFARELAGAVGFLFRKFQELGSVTPGGPNTLIVLLAGGYLTMKAVKLYKALKDVVLVLQEVTKWEAISGAAGFGGGAAAAAGGVGSRGSSTGKFAGAAEGAAEGAAAATLASRLRASATAQKLKTFLIKRQLYVDTSAAKAAAASRAPWLAKLLGGSRLVRFGVWTVAIDLVISKKDRNQVLNDLGFGNQKHNDFDKLRSKLGLPSGVLDRPLNNFLRGEFKHFGFGEHKADKIANFLVTPTSSQAKADASQVKTIIDAGTKAVQARGRAILNAKTNWDQLFSSLGVNYNKLKGDIKDATKALQKQNTVLAQAFQPIIDKADQAFEAVTSGLLEKLQVSVRAAGEVFKFSADQYSPLSKTPAERELEALDKVEAKRQRILDMADARQQLRDALKARRAATFNPVEYEIGDRIFQVRSDASSQEKRDANKAVRDARERLRGLKVDARRDQLTQRANVERAAAEQALAQAQKNLQASRDVEKESLDRQLGTILKQIQNGKVGAEKGTKEILAVLAAHKLDYATVGTAVGQAFVGGFQTSLKLLQSQADKTYRDFAQLLKLKKELDKVTAQQRKAAAGEDKAVGAAKAANPGVPLPPSLGGKTGQFDIGTWSGALINFEGGMIVTDPADAERMARQLARKVLFR